MRYKISFCLMMVIILFCFTIACERDDLSQESREVINTGIAEKENLKNTNLSVKFREFVQDHWRP